jgi:hypothetical protein
MPYGGFLPTSPSTGYDNKSALNVEYRLSVAVDRDSRFNREELEEYSRTAAELEFGANFYRRAHP